MKGRNERSLSMNAGFVPAPRLARFNLGRLPSRSTLTKFWNTRQSTRKSQPLQTEWVEGDLLWARLSGYPTWPCMVTRDPFTNQFAKKLESNNSNSHSYHVQFFGVGGERSWVKDESLMEFRGRKEFIEEARKAPYRYKITSTWVQKLNFAIAQADKCLPLSRCARRKRCTLRYVFGASERSLQRVLSNHFRFKPQ